MSDAVSTYRCPACEKTFVVLGERLERPLFCVACGAALSPAALRPGIYELRSADPYPAHDAEPTSARKTKPDLGYGPSHGYGPAHGGPSGPGDKPSSG